MGDGYGSDAVSLTTSNIFDEGFSNPTDERYVLQVDTENDLPDAEDAEDGFLAIDRDTLHLWQVVSEAWVDRGVLPGAGGGGGGSVAWGEITGTLSDQTDLTAALAAKSSTGHTHEGAALSSTGVTAGWVLKADGSAGVEWAAETAAAPVVSPFTAVSGNTTITDAHLGGTIVYAGGAGNITLTVDDGVSDGFYFSVINTSSNVVSFATEGADSLVPGNAQLVAPESGGVMAASVYHNNGTVWVITAERRVEAFSFACSDETTALTTGTAKVTYRWPYAFIVTDVRASVTTAPTGSAITVDINESDTTILSTKLTIDAGETTSTTAATPAVIADAAIADDAKVTIDVDVVGSSVAGAGLKVTLLGVRA